MDESVLIEYIKGTLDATACKKAEEWISLSEENKKIVENLWILWFVGDRIDAYNSIDVEAAFHDFLAKKNASSSAVLGKQNTRRLWGQVAAVAAVIVIVFSLGIFTTTALLERNDRPTEIATNLGERAQVTLPDGSKVWLNACSSIKYHQSLFSRKRKAALKGEAYFEIAHNKRLPFVVSFNEAEIEVLGTKFNARSNEDEPFITATLIDGSIRFVNKSSDLSVKIKPGEELIFDKTHRQYHLTKPSAPQDALNWIHGKMTFKNASLEEIAKSLERHYNMHIYFADEQVKQERFNAEFEITDNIYQILSILELTNKFNYEIKNRRDVIISARE
ncbi:MAG: DUF4974 domain-containing protein [Proteiniphilum sp.]|nr:DUF4974 domain-containing protein [Proteiniphilum sp.]MDD4157976.1 DUF4974 domain-containing protein [Proteiniphilum sp.]MDD4799625.1 DUF4974 domain-containing protein [Proteiniphilum sp.]